MSTNPSIFTAQNTTDRRRLVAAFARLYSDAKLVFASRVLVVFVLAFASAAVSLAVPDLRAVVGGVGGVVLLVASFVVGGVEKWLRMRAASTQEKFDTEVFALPWNNLLADRPSNYVISKAAKRYKGTRAGDWYADTQGVHRPFDVLICQAANLGWGASMHRIWGWLLVATSIVVAGVVCVTARLANLSLADAFLALVVPALAPMKELGDQIRLNFEASKTKESAEAKVSDLWAKGMDGSKRPSEQDLRAVQDRILTLRQSNPYVPDWLDDALRDKNEGVMQSTADDRIAEARRHGLSD